MSGTDNGLVVTIGLEIHAELSTARKIFCKCENKFGGEPNTRCCPVCRGLPGTLPVLNLQAVEYAVRAGLSLGCRIAGDIDDSAGNGNADKREPTRWERKNYFYPDLPKAYQISQMARPLCLKGSDPRIHHIHLEEDAGKLLHEDESGATFSVKDAQVDFNRCGVPLLELVSEPVFHSIDSAVAFFEEVRTAYIYAGVCDGKMQEGSMRADVNISLATAADTAAGRLGTRSEIKNVNSLTAIAAALEYEIERQTDIINAGGAVEQDTRRWNSALGVTVSMRSKEDAHDYRYFPDPDIPSVWLTSAEIDAVRRTLPETAAARRTRYTEGYGLNEKSCDVILSNVHFSNFYDSAAAVYSTSASKLANYFITEVLRRVNAGELTPEELSDKLNPADFAALVRLVNEGKLSGANQKDVLREMIETGGTPDGICEKRGLFIKEDLTLVEDTITRILAENGAAVAQYRGGDTKNFNFLMGKCNKELKGAATPAKIKSVLERMLAV